MCINYVLYNVEIILMCHYSYYDYSYTLDVEMWKEGKKSMSDELSQYTIHIFYVKRKKLNMKALVYSWPKRCSNRR